MSPDYPPQTIVDSPWKEGEYLLVLVEQPRAFTLGSRIDHALSGSFLSFPTSPPSSVFSLPLSFSLFFLFCERDIDSRA